MNNQALIQKFYESFSAGDAEGMTACYHDEVTFEDPAFGLLKGEQAKGMWRMLLSRTDRKPDVQFSDVQANEQSGSATWIAKYAYGPKKRPVTNHVSAEFTFADGKIISHRDRFDLWKWSQQALGLGGYLLGWSSFMKKTIQKKTNGLLKKFMNSDS